ncbi:MAG: glutamate--tRNA ligase, partial [Candidatus Gracilibacteria bacterium]
MIKTRFAPSPTGYLHVGGLRTALYCYLFARKNKGKFILRIEDTDRERFVEGATEALICTLDWIGLDRDEGPISQTEQKGDFGPYIQSQRSDIYRKYADELVKKGAAYYCFCTKERLDELRHTQEKSKQATMYDRKCGEIPLEEARKRIAAGEPHVIRQRIPYETLKFKDLIRGTIQFDGKIIDDQVLVKSDGFPTYHLANVVDDHLMGITHVIRGEEWLPSTPKHIFLYRAFGWKEPEFAHIPLLLNKDRSKLSKRQGHVAVEEYINDGYTKEAIINFVALLGWHPGAGEENELFSLTELEERFSLDRVHKAGAIFDIEKLDWFNWLWQKRLFNKAIRNSARVLDPKVQITEEKRGVLT